MENSHGTTRPDRKTIEKNRRIHMKALYSKLISLLPTTSTKEGVAATLPDRLDEAISYIKSKQETLEKMRKRKRQLIGSTSMGSEEVTGSEFPKIQFQDLSSGLGVLIVSNPSYHQLVFWEVVRVLEVEGFEVVTASYAVVGDKVFQTIQSSSTDRGRTGEAGKVMERLKKAIHAN